MTFALTNFAPAGNTAKPLKGAGTATITGAPSIWSYATNDTVATVRAANYFAGVVSHLNQGDWILASCDLDGTPAPAIFYVNAVDKSAGTVDVTDGTAISVTDTD